MSTTSHEQRAPGRQLWGHLGHVRSGGMSQSEGAASVAGTGSSAGPAWVLNVTQHRTTPHESLHCFLVHPEFSLPGPSWQHWPSWATCQQCQLCLTCLPALLCWHCHPSARACVLPVPAASQGPKTPAFSGQWGETQWVQTHHGHWPSAHTRAKWGKRGALCPAGNEPGWGSLARSLGRAHLHVGRDEETQSKETTYPLLTGRLSIKIQTIIKKKKRKKKWGG